MTISKWLWLFFNKKITKKLLAYSLLIIFFYILRDFLWLFLLTFIFWYLALSLWEFFKENTDFFISRTFSDRKTRKILKTIFSIKFFVIIEYIWFIILILILFTKLIPNIIQELYEIAKSIPDLKIYIDNINDKLNDFKQIKEIWWSFSKILNNSDIFSEKNLEILKSVFEQIKTASWILIKIFLALVLSFIFIIDINKVKSYFAWIKKTSFSFFYYEYSLIANIVVDSFGRVFKAQAIIAFINTTLTVIWLIIIGFIYKMTFPFIYTLAMIVFIAWFIPVAWVFISSIPIIIVAITMVGWIEAWFLVLILILAVHFIEAYYLNPKILSSFMEMPISMTFLILIISEHLFWVIWLVVWVSMFYFIKELFRDIDKITKKTSKKLEKKKKIEKMLCKNI